MEPSPEILLVNRSIIVDNDRLLVVQRSHHDRRHPGLWEFPGGKVDPGEAIHTGMKREIQEETGLIVEPASELTYVDTEQITSGRYAGRLYIALFRTAIISSGQLLLSDEHEAASWDTLDEASDRNLSPESRRALEAFRRSDLF